MIRRRRVALLLLCLPAILGSGQPASSQRLEAKVWVGRHREVEEFLRTAECVSMEMFGPSHAGRCTLRPGGPVARMAWRPLPPGVYRGFRESYKAEIAAYELDKLLKMDMVPPSVERQLEGNRGAAQLWAENVTDASGEATPGEPDRAHWEAQLVLMKMFDNLMGYRDRNRGNMLHDASWNLILIDHSRAFGDRAELPQKLSRIDHDFWARIETLTRSQLDAALGAWLGDDEIRALLDRRDRMRAEIKLLPR